MAVTLGEALKSAIARGMIDGNGGIGVPSDANEWAKSAGTEAPASFRETLSGQNGTNRCMTVASQSGLPHPAAVIHLVVIEGGRTETGGNTSVRPIRSANPGGRGAHRYLKLVWSDGADHAALANLAARRRPNRLFVGI